MSLLADLLSKVKYQGLKGEIPPNLKQVVTDSTERSAIMRKVVILSFLMLIAIVTGFGAVYVFDKFVKPAAMKPAVSLPQPGKMMPEQAAAKPTAPAVPELAPKPASSPAKVAPAQPAPRKKPLSKRKPVAAISAKEEEALEQPGQYQSSSTNASGRGDGAAEAAKKEPKQLSGEESEKKDMYLYAAKTSESRKDYQKALSNYIKVLELDPGNYIVANNISGIMLMMGRYDEALRYAETSGALKKDYAPALINMGIASIKLNNGADGQRYLAMALALDPSNRNALLNLALLHEKTVEYDKAYSYFYKIAEQGDIQGYLGLARVAEKKGNNPDAARIYREILSMNNIDPSIRKTAGERLSHVEQR
jgi:tetratricopeptide (TPR) repeat protein